MATTPKKTSTTSRKPAATPKKPGAATIVKTTDKQAEVTLKSWKDFSDILSSRVRPHFSLYETKRKINNLQSELNIKNQISKLEQRAEKLSRELSEALEEQKAADTQRDELKGIIEEINAKQKLEHLFRCLSPEAHGVIESDANFRANFDDGKQIEAFVVSIDIRRSTELMLKAKTASAFAKFITTLCADFDNLIKENYGVVDKFTGDGILAYSDLCEHRFW
ncbi:hypothetical protein WG68_13380 [Arsukibacterium ikkense]|uniref:Guanylate cyclase domain-containing protein n=1 Tax=Arsukibacterium ikkense TaxID=336831 RepID=A0A0M2V5A0_9GAMM|nr:hypothetical protein [Arsukibacterium ikkense]KKO44825.1 hypothetical protein WG68_13380 [Arsukibacterium ikkense]